MNERESTCFAGVAIVDFFVGLKVRELGLGNWGGLLIDLLIGKIEATDAFALNCEWNGRWDRNLGLL